MGSKPLRTSVCIPTRSASSSLARVKSMRFWTLPAEIAANAACPASGFCVPSKIAPSMAAATGMLSWEARSKLRAMWRWVTCAISCASTPASSASASVCRNRPLWIPMNPPGAAKALMAGSSTRKKVNGCCAR